MYKTALDRGHRAGSQHPEDTNIENAILPNKYLPSFSFSSDLFPLRPTASAERTSGQRNTSSRSGISDVPAFTRTHERMSGNLTHVRKSLEDGGRRGTSNLSSRLETKSFQAANDWYISSETKAVPHCRLNQPLTAVMEDWMKNASDYLQNQSKRKPLNLENRFSNSYDYYDSNGSSTANTTKSHPTCNNGASKNEKTIWSKSVENEYQEKKGASVVNENCSTSRYGESRNGDAKEGRCFKAAESKYQGRMVNEEIKTRKWSVATRHDRNQNQIETLGNRGNYDNHDEIEVVSKCERGRKNQDRSPCESPTRSFNRKWIERSRNNESRSRHKVSSNLTPKKDFNFLENEYGNRDMREAKNKFQAKSGNQDWDNSETSTRSLNQKFTDKSSRNNKIDNRREVLRPNNQWTDDQSNIHNRNKSGVMNRNRGVKRDDDFIKFPSYPKSQENIKLKDKLPKDSDSRNFQAQGDKGIHKDRFPKDITPQESVTSMKKVKDSSGSPKHVTPIKHCEKNGTQSLEIKLCDENRSKPLDVESETRVVSQKSTDKLSSNCDEVIICEDSSNAISRVCVDVQVMYAVSTNEYYVVAQKDVVSLQIIDNLPRQPLEAEPILDAIYLSVFEDFGCRAKIVKLKPLTVMYIDFGNSEVIEIDRLFEIPLQWQKNDALAFKIELIESEKNIENGEIICIEYYGDNRWKRVR